MCRISLFFYHSSGLPDAPGGASVFFCPSDKGAGSQLPCYHLCREMSTKRQKVPKMITARPTAQTVLPGAGLWGRYFPVPIFGGGTGNSHIKTKDKKGIPLTVGKIAAGTWVGNILNVTGKRIKPGINFLEINYPERFRVYSASI